MLISFFVTAVLMLPAQTPEWVQGLLVMQPS